MIGDEVGFLFPYVNLESCNGCLLCEKVCPVLNKKTINQYLEKPLVYACFHKTIDVRRESTSGGAFSALSSLVFNRNGYVFGASFNENMELSHTYINNEEDLGKLRKSKYVQSTIGLSYAEVEGFLKRSNWVLFTGTPCQIAGLCSYLGRDYERLITAEIFCHGTPSPLLFEKFVQYAQDKHNDKIVDINFRDKKYGWENGMVISALFKKKGKRYLRFQYSSYIKFFLNSMNLRNSCYECNFKGLPRQADFSLGDFWGIGAKNKFEHLEEKSLGISVVMVHSEKGEMFIRDMSKILVMVRRTYTEAVDKNQSFLRPQKKNSQYEEFRQDLIDNSFRNLIKKYNPLSYRRIIYEIISILFGKNGLNRLVKLARR
jgi:coenzyme F420-reducing hydrogenase beta subunit